MRAYMLLCVAGYVALAIEFGLWGLLAAVAHVAVLLLTVRR